VESDTRQFLLKSLYRKESGTLAWRINIPVIDAQLESIGREITYQEPFVGPVLFVRGEHSQYILDTDTDRITRQFPQATLQTIANAGHWVHADQPQQLDQLVTNFFAS
jgi:pimeloyl-ACP methyl ester carboxylesterase